MKNTWWIFSNFLFLYKIGLHKFTSNQTLFEAGVGYSYRCDSQTQIKNFVSDDNLKITSIDITNLRIQPFVDDGKPFNAYNDGLY